MHAFSLLQAHKHVVMENSAHRNTARFFALRNVDIASAAYIISLQVEIENLLSHIGRCGQVRVMHVCQMIVRQPSHAFELLHVWATCALSGRSTNQAICIGSHTRVGERVEGRTRRSECCEPIVPTLLDPLAPGGPENMVAQQPALFVDASFEPFVRALWLCTHIAQLESVRVLERTAQHIAAAMQNTTEGGPTTMAAVFDEMLLANALSDTRVTSAYESAFVYALGVLRTTVTMLDDTGEFNAHE